MTPVRQLFQTPCGVWVNCCKQQPGRTGLSSGVLVGMTMTWRHRDPHRSEAAR